MNPLQIRRQFPPTTSPRSRGARLQWHLAGMAVTKPLLATGAISLITMRTDCAGMLLRPCAEAYLAGWADGTQLWRGHQESSEPKPHLKACPVRRWKDISIRSRISARVTRRVFLLQIFAHNWATMIPWISFGVTMIKPTPMTRSQKFSTWTLRPI